MSVVADFIVGIQLEDKAQIEKAISTEIHCGACGFKFQFGDGLATVSGQARVICPKCNETVVSVAKP